MARQIKLNENFFDKRPITFDKPHNFTVTDKFKKGTGIALQGSPVDKDKPARKGMQTMTINKKKAEERKAQKEASAKKAVERKRKTDTPVSFERKERNFSDSPFRQLINRLKGLGEAGA